MIEENARERIVKGSLVHIVQAAIEGHDEAWGGIPLVVDEVRPWGVIASCRMPHGSSSPRRCGWEEIESLGVGMPQVATDQT